MQCSGKMWKTQFRKSNLESFLRFLQWFCDPTNSVVHHGAPLLSQGWWLVESDFKFPWGELGWHMWSTLARTLMRSTLASCATWCRKLAAWIETAAKKHGATNRLIKWILQLLCLIYIYKGDGEPSDVWPMWDGFCRFSHFGSAWVSWQLKCFFPEQLNYNIEPESLEE